MVDGIFVFLRQYLIFGRGSGTIYQKIYLSTGWVSCFLRDSSLWHFFERRTQLSPLPSFELLLSSLEPFFEWPTQLSPLLSKTSQLSTILSKSARLSTFLSAQKSKFTLESPFLSGFTLLSAQKSAHGTSQPLWNRLQAQLFSVV